MNTYEKLIEIKRTVKITARMRTNDIHHQKLLERSIFNMVPDHL